MKRQLIARTYCDRVHRLVVCDGLCDLCMQFPRKEMNTTEQYIDACKQIEKQKEGT